MHITILKSCQGLVSLSLKVKSDVRFYASSHSKEAYEEVPYIDWG